MNTPRHYPTRDEAVAERIDEIMDTFDFAKVAAHMKYVNWTWVNDDVPDAYQIRQEARKKLRHAAKERCERRGGGFLVSYRDGIEDDKPWFTLNLYFVLEDGSDDGVSYDTDNL